MTRIAITAGIVGAAGALTLAFAAPSSALTYSADVEAQIDQSVSDSIDPVELSTPTSDGGEAAARAGAGVLGVKATETGSASASFQKSITASILGPGGTPYTGSAFLSFLFYTTGSFAGDGGELRIFANTDVDDSQAFIAHDSEDFLGEQGLTSTEQLSNRAFIDDGTTYFGFTSRLGLGGAEVGWEAESALSLNGQDTSVSNFLRFDLAFVPGDPFAFELEFLAEPNVGANLSGGVDFFGTSTLTSVGVTLDDPDFEIADLAVTAAVAGGGTLDLVALAEANAAALLAPVPVPAPLSLLGAALAGLWVVRRRVAPGACRVA
mgnify:CR=1 FL=1